MFCSATLASDDRPLSVRMRNHLAARLAGAWEGVYHLSTLNRIPIVVLHPQHAGRGRSKHLTRLSHPNLIKLCREKPPVCLNQISGEPPMG